MRRIIRIIIFCSLFISIFVMVTMLLKPKWYYNENGWEAVTKIEDGAYAEPKNSIDVAYIGSSHAFRGISPLTIWKNYKITGYVYGSSMQRMWISDYYLKEALKHQKPKVVVLDVYGILFNDENDEDRNRKALDYMHFSKNKISAILNSIPNDGSESFISYLFPIMRYHSRWNQLEQKDFEYFIADKSFYLKGSDPYFDSPSQASFDFENSDENKFVIDMKVKKHLDNIVNKCNEGGGGELILIKTPTAGWTRGMSKAVSEYAVKNGVEFLDYSLFYKSLGISEETDYMDMVHLNAYGAEKLSQHLGNYIVTNYLPEYKNITADVDNWNLCYDKYYNLKSDYELSVEYNLNNYIKKLNNPNYVITIATKGNMNEVDKAIAKRIEEIGLSQISIREMQESYISITIAGETIFESNEAEPMKYRKLIDDIPFEISSSGAGNGNDVSIMIDGTEYSKKQQGLNIVVYDTLLDKVVDSCYFVNTDSVVR